MGSSEIERIVREAFNDSGSDDLSQLLMYYVTPGIFKNMKREMLENVLREKVRHINGNIRWVMKLNNIEIIAFDVEDEKKFVNFLIEGCIYEVEQYKNYAIKVVKFGGGLFKSMMGMGMESSSYYVIFKSLKRTISDFFTAIYIYKKTISDAENNAHRVFKYCYLESLGM